MNNEQLIANESNYNKDSCDSIDKRIDEFEDFKEYKVGTCKTSV